jgi:hypothetical protein
MVFIVVSPIVVNWFGASVSVPSAYNDNGRLAAANALAEPMMNWRREIEEFTECSDFPTFLNLLASSLFHRNGYS